MHAIVWWRWGDDLSYHQQHFIAPSTQRHHTARCKTFCVCAVSIARFQMNSQGQVTKIETHSNYNTFKSKYNLNELTPKAQTALIKFILGGFWKAFRIYRKENAFNRSICAPRILLLASFNVMRIAKIRPL